ncbi:LCP family protein [Thermanaeromonas sp. C210]|uniref:LCP family protein n=1 Tax=Thermanaeromonas sp. C210 TaxID=2731925 RepID=UPI00155CDC48|nr:LCP family protein [Thermanaeromonas sp. C210]GFN21776.1 cell envelope-related transcriptional attenuator [Thermanaeromonas sp. C210]
MKNGYTDREFWGEAQDQARPARRGSLFFRVLILAFLSLITFAGFGLAGYRLAAHWLGAPTALGGTTDPVPPEEPRILPRAVLLIGVDARQEKEPSRSDTIMVAFLDEAGRRIDILSIPRDSYVRIPGHGSDKINAAHAFGGPELLMETVNSLLGTRVAKYVEVDFQGFEKIVDTLGGVDIEVDKRMYYPEEGIDLQAGFQHLNGRDALSYVRFRNDPEGDITRIGRQQKFLKAMLEQAFKLSTIPKIPRLVSDLNKYVQTNLSTAEMVSLALFLKDLDSSTVVTHTVPGEGKYINGISYWVIDEEKLEEVLNSIPGLKGR